MQGFRTKKFVAFIGLLSVFAGWLLSGADRMTLVALGDCIMSQRLSAQSDARFLKLAEIIRSADCAWANCEGPIVDIAKAYPEYRPGDLNVYCQPWSADDLKWLGVDCVGLANNHTRDYGYTGLFSTIESLERVGVGYAGAGKDLDDAARPRYVDTPAGRVGQVNFASWFSRGTHAAPSHPHMNGRPGLNPLRVEGVLQIPRAYYEAVQNIGDDFLEFFDFDLPEEERQAMKKAIVFGNKAFELADSTGYYGKIDEADLKRITSAIAVARRNARIVIASNHEHIGADKQNAPMKFLETTARACIDAGADVFVGTGPHRLWGIEIYKGKPVFYSLGNFIMQSGSVEFPPENYMEMGFAADTRDPSVLEEKVNGAYFNNDEYWRGVVPVMTFENENELKEILLYPIVLGKDEPMHRQGTPRLAAAGEGKAIIDKLAKLSQRFNTTIVFRERQGIGVIRLE
jgi:poly-gamma-glutamate synthesis protein (capsule biosynthesis protein)